MKQHLEVFSKLIDTINGSNVALAGALSLKAHGLLLGRDGADLDVVIFSPTEKQLAALENLNFFRVTNKNQPKYPLDREVSVKFKKDGLTIDFLLEHGKETPTDLLYYEHEGTYYKVQSVEGTIAAKRSFKDDEGRMRYKDVMDLLDLKSQNFNLR